MMAADQSVNQGIPPPSLSAEVVGSFAYLTVRDRLPSILTKVIDTIRRNKNRFFEKYGEEECVRAEEAAVTLLSKLRNEIQTDKAVLALTDGLKDTDAWNLYLQRQLTLRRGLDPSSSVSWFKSPWLYVECYMYRRIQEALWLNPPIGDFDVFGEEKAQSFFGSLQAIIALCTYLQGLYDDINDVRSEMRLMEQFCKLLQVSLWGNKCDLSISAGQENSQKADPLDSLPRLHPFILVDDSNEVWTTLVSAKKKPAGGGESDTSTPGRVDVVLDNAGFELVTDLVLADFLLFAGLAREVHFHGKSIPWFVSDVTANDFHWTVRQTASSDRMSRSGARWQGYLREGVWTYHDHPFWTQPHGFRDMAAEAPDLYAALQRADLVLFKGDLNYRKLTGDRHWDHAATFGTALQGFGPTPLCSLRTLKANTQVGLKPGQAEELSSQDPGWMTSGKYGVIQFYSPTWAES